MEQSSSFDDRIRAATRAERVAELEHLIEQKQLNIRAGEYTLASKRREILQAEKSIAAARDDMAGFQKELEEARDAPMPETLA